MQLRLAEKLCRTKFIILLICQTAALDLETNLGVAPLVGLLGLGLLLFFVVMAISGQVALAQDAGTTSTLGFLSSTDEQVAAGAGAAGAGARAGRPHPAGRPPLPLAPGALAAFR